MSLKTGLPLADADLAPSSLCSGRQRAMPGGSPSSLLNNGSSSISSLHELQCDGQVVCSSSEQSVNWLAPRPPIKGARARGLGKGSVRDLADDEELRRMSTDELVSELKRSWDESDATAALVADLEALRDTLQASNDHLVRLVSSYDGENAETEADRARLEDELEENLALVDRLRERVGALERETREVGRRYAEQAKSFDAERQALYDNEQSLKSRLQASSARLPTPAVRPQSLLRSFDAATVEAPVSNAQALSDDVDAGDDCAARIADLKQQLEAGSAELDAAKADLRLLERSYDSLQHAMERNSDELSDLKQANARLQDDIESYDLLLTERTFSGAMRSNGLLSRSYSGPSALADTLDPVREDAAGETALPSVGELDPELVSPSQPGSATRPSFDFDPAFVNGASEEQTFSDSKRKIQIDGADWILENDEARRQIRGDRLGDYPVTGSGLDLAAELGRAEADMGEGELRRLEKGDDGDALRAEVKSLKEANKALALYTSKILDRILSVDGFENILSTDAGGSLQGSMRRTRTLRGSTTSRPALQASTFAAVSPGSQLAADYSPAPPVTVEEKKVRRSSIDWRGGFAALFGSTPASPTVATPPIPSTASRLRPLRLSVSPKPVVGARESLSSQTLGSAHRISRADEIEEEEDRLQLKRVALLRDQLQEEDGEPALSSPTSARPLSGQRRQASSSSARTHASSLSLSGRESPSGRRAPLDTLVDHFGASGQDSYFSSLASVGAGEKVTEDLVAAHLRDVDQDEQRKASVISAGRSGGFTEPNQRMSISSRRTSISSRRTSRQPSETSERSFDDGR